MYLNKLIVKSGLVLVVALGAVAAFSLAVPEARAYFCDPPGPATQQNCWKDDKPDPAGSYTCGQLGGFCRNRVCQCGVSDPGLCADRPNCPLPYCPPGSTSCGGHSVSVSGGTVHVTDCRCIAGYPGGCISYCAQSAPPPPPPPPAAPVLTVTCTGGFTPQANLSWNLVADRNSNTVEKGDAYPSDPNAFWNFIDRFPWYQPAPGYNQTTYADTNVVVDGTYSWRVKAKPQLPSNVVTMTLDPATCGAPPTDRAMYLSQTVPSSVNVGQTFPVTVTMRNNGTTTWTTAGQYKLGSENPKSNNRWGVTRAVWSLVNGVPSSGPVARNANATFVFNVTAPSVPGTYSMQWGMLREGVAWFTATTPTTPATNITVIDPNQPPTGSFDAVNCNAESSWGWARDPNNAPSPISVHIYRDGPAGAGGAFVASVTANENRPDIPYGDKNHGFSYALPAASPLRDGNPHTYYAYAINTPAGPNPQLIGSPRSMTCRTIPQVTSLTHTGPDYCTAGPSATLGWVSTAFPQTAYRVQIATDPGFTSVVYDTGKVPQIALKPFRGLPQEDLADDSLLQRLKRAARKLFSFSTHVFAASYCGQTSGVEQGGIDGNQAVMTITSPSDGQVFTNPNITVSGTLVSNPLGYSQWGGDPPGCPGGSPVEQGWISNIRVFLNGGAFTNCLTGVSCSINGPGTFATYSKGLTLAPGANTITVEGIHRYEPYYMPRCHTGITCTLGTRSSPAIRTITVTYNPPGPPTPTPGPGGTSTWSITTPSGILNFNTTYYARAKVWDSSTPVGQEGPWSSAVNWTTAKHAYPRPEFAYSPATVRANDPVQFTDQTVFAAAPLSWSWSFGDGATSTDQNPEHTYSAIGSKDVMLQATDIDGYACSTTKTLDAKEALPKFKEVLPR